jgi:hypothetical protein
MGSINWTGLDKESERLSFYGSHVHVLHGDFFSPFPRPIGLKQAGITKNIYKKVLLVELSPKYESPVKSSSIKDSPMTTPHVTPFAPAHMLPAKVPLLTPLESSRLD